MKTTGAKVEKVEDDLAGFAAEREPGFKNRAAVVLALAGKPKEALELYQPDGEEKNQFKQLIRKAEWAMAAKDMEGAQEAAWKALPAARLTRDRRYALTILSEAYRRDKKLDDLIERFSREPDLHDDARLAWIDLLREKGDADQALALFEAAREKEGGGFSIDMQRRLLEICREAGRFDKLTGTFREMIERDPKRLEWRTGLCRYYLERGEREKGVAVWADYENHAPTGALLGGAEATMGLGLDEVAQRLAEATMETGDETEKMAALQFLFTLRKQRSDEDGMKAMLERMDQVASPAASERAQLAESWEQMGRQDRAAEVLENLREARGSNDFSSDLETRLAWLYSETGREEKAYEAWKNVWMRIESPGRRRYIEDRLMATASRLGKLADIAIELEEKLMAGTADKRDSALLVRLYTKVGDPVSAAEIIQGFMKQTGGSEIAMLEEQARVYVMCNDYYHYEKALRKLMELDPEGSPEYLTQLAMSALERGRNDQARAILTEMRELEQNPASAEFEAGVLKIAGMHREAANAYWRGIAEHPDRIDAYLLLGRALQTLNKGSQAAGLFQYLVENAESDDLFTVAVDGLLNMNNPQQGSRLSKETLEWARRTILARVAGKDDKVYLFQLLNDVSEDLRDNAMMTRAMAETLPIAGERRTAYLRELMELARAGAGRSGFSSGRSKPRDREGMLRFGRRLIGIGEAVPPQVYLDLGSSFLDSGDILNARKTFDRANALTDVGGYRRQVAGVFEQQGYMESALGAYEKLLIGEFSNIGLVLKVGELKEQLGRDDEAAAAYRGALDLLINGRPLFLVKEEKKKSNQPIYYYSGNIDDFGKYYQRALTGFLTAASRDEDYQTLFADYEKALETDLARATREMGEVREGDRKTLALSYLPRIARRSELLRRVAFAFGDSRSARRVEERLLRALPEDKELLPSLCRQWESWGYSRTAAELVEAFPDHPGAEKAQSLVGLAAVSELERVFRHLLRGEEREARDLLRNLDRLLESDEARANQNALFAAARFLGESDAVERLARNAIARAPAKQKLMQSVNILRQSYSSLETEHRERLARYVEGVLKQQDLGDQPSAYYYFRELNRMTGARLTLPVKQARSQVNNLLAKGGYYLQQVGP
ncbi:MAG: hypothetical protein AAF514_12415, partial [Verrucomicrobiota bacterium]